MSSAGEVFDMCDGKAGALCVEMFEELPARFGTNVGTFIAMNEGLYVGANSSPEYDRERHVEHHELAEAVLLREGREIPDDEVLEVQSDNIRLMKLFGITDAGLAFFFNETNQKRLEITGISGSFHAVEDEAERIRSASLAKKILGSEVQIVLL